MSAARDASAVHFVGRCFRKRPRRRSGCRVWCHVELLYGCLLLLASVGPSWGFLHIGLLRQSLIWILSCGVRTIPWSSATVSSKEPGSRSYVLHSRCLKCVYGVAQESPGFGTCLFSFGARLRRSSAAATWQFKVAGFIRCLGHIEATYIHRTVYLPWKYY